MAASSANVANTARGIRWVKDKTKRLKFVERDWLSRRSVIIIDDEEIIVE